MKSIIFALLFAVAFAVPAPKPDDEKNEMPPSPPKAADSRRFMYPSMSRSSDREDDDSSNFDIFGLNSVRSSDREDDDDDDDNVQSDREDDDDDNVTYESRSSSSGRSQNQWDREDDDDDNVTYESRSSSSSSSSGRMRTSQRVADLSSYLDYLNDKYQGRGVLKVEYDAAANKFNRFSRTYNLGSLHFSYHPPSNQEVRSKNSPNYYVYQPSRNAYKSGYEASAEDEPSYRSPKKYNSYSWNPNRYSNLRDSSWYSRSNGQDNFDSDDNSRKVPGTAEATARITSIATIIQESN